MSAAVGLATGACHSLSILDTIDAIAGSGVTGLEIGTPPRHFDLWQSAQIGAVAERLGRHRLRAVSIHAPFGIGLDLADPQERHRHAALEAIGAAARAIKRLGGRIVVVHPSDLPRHAHDVAARLADSARGLSELARACRQEDLTLPASASIPGIRRWGDSGTASSRSAPIGSSTSTSATTTATATTTSRPVTACSTGPTSRGRYARWITGGG
jgi:sugar phosphate isomerase/epimerase